MGGVEVHKKWHAPCARGGHRHFERNNLPAQEAAIGRGEYPATPPLEQTTATPPVEQTATTGPSEQASAMDPSEQTTSTRLVASADARDGLALGLAQALALIPGVSRSGATLAAARARGFSRQDADQLSWTVGLPVIAGATMLQGTRLAYASRHEQTARVQQCCHWPWARQRIPLHARQFEGARSTQARPTATGLYRLQRCAGGLCDPAHAR